MGSFNILIVGILISIIFYEITNISPGGIIVPGIVVAYFNQPLKIIYTILISVITYFIVKLLSKRLLIFGKRRFVIFILISILINFIISLFIDIFAIKVFALSLIGYTISGLIANDIHKQGIFKTLISLGIVTCILEIIVIISRSL